MGQKVGSAVVSGKGIDVGSGQAWFSPASPSIWLRNLERVLDLLRLHLLTPQGVVGRLL